MGRRETTAALNDRLRTTFKGGRIQMTRNVYDLDDRLRGRALSVLARYNSFDADSDHDSGVFIFAGFAFEWRIEYRSVDGCGPAPDPTDAAKTSRVLTLFVVDDLLSHNRDTGLPYPLTLRTNAPYYRRFFQTF
jgi:Protein of unknown function (DUF3768)